MSFSSSSSSIPSSSSPSSQSSGLGILAFLDRIFIDRKAEGWEDFPEELSQNCYAILDMTGQPLFSVQESSENPGKLFLGNSQDLEIKVFDRYGSEVLKITKPHSYIGDEVEVFIGSTKLGSIKRDAFSLIPKVRVHDAKNNRILKISGPLFRPEDEFEVKSQTGRKIGELKKQNLESENGENIWKYGVNFPLSLYVMEKVLLMAVTILMNFDYFHCS